MAKTDVTTKIKSVVPSVWCKISKMNLLQKGAKIISVKKNMKN